MSKRINTLQLIENNTYLIEGNASLIARNVDMIRTLINRLAQAEVAIDLLRKEMTNG